MTNTDTNENMSYYEVGYLLAPTLPDDEAAETETDLHEQITSADGEIVSAQSPEMRELSYEIEVKEAGEQREFSRAQFGWVQFSFNPEDVNQVESIFAQADDVIRHLLITVDADDLTDDEANDEAEA